MLILV
jgi:hypothetical protein